MVGLFENSVSSFYWPQRVRSDHGMENIGVARLMLGKFGIDSKPFITGPSVHNQRIERMWKDVLTYVVKHHRDLFYSLEDEGLLDPLDAIHLYALEYVFVPRINRDLHRFIESWNNHPMRTVFSKTPIQIWTEGIYQNIGDGCLIEENIDPEHYGIDFDGPMPHLQTVNDIQVPELDIQLNENQLNELSGVDPLGGRQQQRY